MKGKIKQRREWRNALNLMTVEELLHIVHHQVGYDSTFIDMAYEELSNGPYAEIEQKAMSNSIFGILDDMGCTTRREGDAFIFRFQGEDYEIGIDDEFDHIVIRDNNWKTLKLKDEAKVNETILAINKTNIWNAVTIAYLVDLEDGVMEVFSLGKIPYFPDMDYLKKFIPKKLDEMQESHQLVDFFVREMQKSEEGDSAGGKTSIDLN